MRDGNFRVLCFAATALVLAVAACGGSKTPAPADKSQPVARAPAGPVVATAPGPQCPATGLWAPCSLLYRLDRAGLAPNVDSSATPDEKTLTGAPLVIKIGFTAKLEVRFYPDSAARIADEQKLDRTQYVTPDMQQTMKRERTLIANANMVGLLTSINDHQRERVADALMAGPPQAPAPATLAPSTAKP